MSNNVLSSDVIKKQMEYSSSHK